MNWVKLGYRFPFFKLAPTSVTFPFVLSTELMRDSVRSEGGEAAAGYCLNSVSYRVDEAVKYNVLNSD